MRTLIISLSLPLLLGLAAAGCDEGTTGDIQPEPTVDVDPSLAAPDQVPVPTPSPAAGDTEPAQQPTAQQPPAVDPGSCCGSEACGSAGHGGSEGCGCRRNLPPDIARQVNCGG